MKPQLERRSIGASLAEKAGPAVTHYDMYVWMVHTHDFPEDRREGEEMFGTDPSMIEQRLAEWAGASRQRVAIALGGQLNLVLKATLQATQITPNYEEALQTGYESVAGAYLTQIVGPLAMKDIKREAWYRNNERLALLRNPFESRELREFLWRRQELGSTAIKGRVKLPSYELFVPGYEKVR